MSWGTRSKMMAVSAATSALALACCRQAPQVELNLARAMWQKSHGVLLSSEMFGWPTTTGLAMSATLLFLF